jgi:hypothetical protein
MLFVTIHYFDFCRDNYKIGTMTISNAKKWFDDVLTRGAWLADDVRIFSLLFGILFNYFLFYLI